MTLQEFNFLLAIAEYGWSKAEYHWTYLLLFDPDGNDVAKYRLRLPVTVGRTRRSNEKAGKASSGHNSITVPLPPESRARKSPEPSDSQNTKSRARR
jgi:hypothetical protein